MAGYYGRYSSRTPARRGREGISYPFERCRELYVVDCVALKVTASVGFSLFPSHAEDAAGLLQRAERALYRAKIAGRDCYYPMLSP